VRVAVAVIVGGDGEILITRRHAHAHQGGLWEFPGGKFEADESIGEALQRELREEIGIRVRAHEPLLIIEHDYGDKHVVLDVHRVTGFEGEPAALEGQGMRWVRVDELSNYSFPAANARIVERLMDDD
jgi:8-oxo-dGTP diphosphatase